MLAALSQIDRRGWAKRANKYDWVFEIGKRKRVKNKKDPSIQLSSLTPFSSSREKI